MTRQQRRHEARIEVWAEWKVQRNPDGTVNSAPHDDHGILPRRKRRSIALALARKKP